MAIEFVVVTCRGHLTPEQLEAELFVAESAFDNADSPMTLVVDCIDMTTYDRAARAMFVDWNKAHREVICEVVVLTTNQLHNMVISAMALASSQRMRVVKSRAEWAQQAV